MRRGWLLCLCGDFHEAGGLSRHHVILNGGDDNSIPILDLTHLDQVVPSWRIMFKGARDPKQLPHRCRRKLHVSQRPVVAIDKATFYRRHPSSLDTSATNPALYPNLCFSLIDPQSWSVISTSSLARTTFLQLVAGQHICIPPTARSYPRLSQLCKFPDHAVKYVGFDADRGNNLGGSRMR